LAHVSARGACALVGCLGAARHYQPELLDGVLAGRISPGKVVDLTTDLDHIADADAAMDHRRAITALIKISER
jgi:alcohol dehydrogenase